MSLSEKIAAQLPYLRRYSRALTGSQVSGDAFVRATLEAALADKELLSRIGESRAQLFAAFTQIWKSGHLEMLPADSADNAYEDAAHQRLSEITPLHRQALLLTTLEEFSVPEVAEVLGIPASEVSDLVGQAVEEIDGQTATDVLVIEDEPLISMRLEDIVQQMGHRVVGMAATHRQATEIFNEKRPGLVLADIQLADGSSGIEAVEDILAMADVPVIFITAYPERLLTGERPEPTYFVTKPFEEATVRAAVSQALFFGVGRA